MMRRLFLSVATLLCSFALVASPGMQPVGLSVVTGGPAPGPDVWYFAAQWSETPGFPSYTDGWSGHLYAYASEVDVVSAGTATKLRVWRQTDSGVGSVGIKIALYDASWNLLDDGYVLAPEDTTATWREVDLTGTAVSATTTYHVMVSQDDANADIGRFTDNQGLSWGSEVSYADFPEDPANSPASESQDFGVAIYVD